jgi:hypothetical protein
MIFLKVVGGKVSLNQCQENKLEAWSDKGSPNLGNSMILLMMVKDTQQEKDKTAHYVDPLSQL